MIFEDIRQLDDAARARAQQVDASVAMWSAAWRAIDARQARLDPGSPAAIAYGDSLTVLSDRRIAHTITILPGKPVHECGPHNWIAGVLTLDDVTRDGLLTWEGADRMDDARRAAGIYVIPRSRPTSSQES